MPSRAFNWPSSCGGGGSPSTSQIGPGMFTYLYGRLCETPRTASIILAASERDNWVSSLMSGWNGRTLWGIPIEWANLPDSALAMFADADGFILAQVEREE